MATLSGLSKLLCLAAPILAQALAGNLRHASAAERAHRDQLAPGRLMALSPLSPDRELESDSASSQSVRTFRLGTVPIVTIETNLKENYRVPGVQGQQTTNYSINTGQGEVWHKRRSKNELLLRWLRSADPEQLAILIDGGDVIFGGCSEADLLERYNGTVAASGGAPLVVSAEMGCFPYQYLAQYDALESRKKDVLTALKRDENWIPKFADCQKSASRNAGWGKCSDPPSYKFLNYGFLMGPVKNLRSMLEFIVAHPKNMTFPAGDQALAMEYMFDHPEEVTLDYAGVLSMSMHNMKVGANDTTMLFSTGKNGHLVNRVTNTVQCFAHGNGNGKNFVASLAEDLSGLPSPCRKYTKYMRKRNGC